MTVVENFAGLRAPGMKTPTCSPVCFKTPAYRRSEKEAMERAGLLAGAGQSARVCQPHARYPGLRQQRRLKLPAALVTPAQSG